MSNESRIQFPCEFTIKIVGKAGSSFEKKVVETMQQHFPAFGRDNYKKRLSRDGNYLAFTVTVYVTSKAELDNLYQSLSQSPDILFVL